MLDLVELKKSENFIKGIEFLNSQLEGFSSKKQAALIETKQNYTSNTLPKIGQFVKVAKFINSKENNFTHFRLFTDSGESVSLSSLFQTGFVGTNVKDIIFVNYKVKSDSSLYNRCRIKNSVPICTNVVNFVGDLSDVERLNLLIGCSFVATEKNIYTYFPNLDKDVAIVSADEANLYEEKKLLSFLDLKTLYTLSEIKKDKNISLTEIDIYIDGVFSETVKIAETVKKGK